MNISKDLETGNTGENLVIKILKKGDFATGKNTEKLIDFDVWGQSRKIGPASYFTIEVKYDLYSEKSGNIAVEYHNSRQNKPSGIYATKAHLWAVVTPHAGIWLTAVPHLKKYIKDNKPLKTIKSGGNDNADLFLYKLDKILPEIFIRVDTLSRQKIQETIRNLLT